MIRFFRPDPNVPHEFRYHRLVVAIFMLVMCGVFAWGATTSGPKQPANMGQSMIKEQFISYHLGFIVDLKVLKYEDELYTVLRTVPYGVSRPMDRGFAFCGNKMEAFIGKGDFVVITYDLTAHGKGCYDLLSVNTVVPPTLKFEVPTLGPLSVPKLP